MESTGCRYCTLEMKRSDAVRLDPCGCFLCKDCMIDLLAESRLNNDSLSCRSCGLDILSHQLERQDSSLGVRVSVERSYQKKPPVEVLETPNSPQEKQTKHENENNESEVEAQHALLAINGSSSNVKVVKDDPNQEPDVQAVDQLNSSTNPQPQSQKKSPTKLPKKGGKKRGRPRKVDSAAQGAGIDGSNKIPRTDADAQGVGDSSDKPAATEPGAQSGDDEKVKRKYNPKRTFDEHLQDLMAFKEKFGHCIVPYRYENRRLAEWVKDIRRGHMKVNNEQRKKLNSVGFNWETRQNKLDREWNERLARLKAYRTIHGDCRVSQSYEDKQLSEWVSTQRKEYKKGNMKATRIKALEVLGFDWSPGLGTSPGPVQSSRVATFSDPDEQVNHVQFQYGNEVYSE